MLKITSKASDASTPCTPNLLPCRIDHNGAVDASQRYWAPETTVDGQPEAYFRGRKLKGREIRVPNGYRGIIVKETEKEKGAGSAEGNQIELMEEEKDEEGETGILQEVGSFDEVVLWGHETLVDGEDAFVRGLGEWIGFAESVSLSEVNDTKQEIDEVGTDD